MIELPKGFRLATEADSASLAELVVIASHGAALKMWEDEAPTGTDPKDYGAELHAARAERGEVVVYDPGEGPVAGLTSYAVREAERAERGTSPSFLPITELEAMAAPCWYILAFATFPQWRQRGLGKRLLQIGDELALFDGMDRVALVVADDNVAAIRIYRNAGYGEVARSPMYRPGLDCPGNEWLLMVKPLGPL